MVWLDKACFFQDVSFNEEKAIKLPLKVFKAAPVIFQNLGETGTFLIKASFDPDDLSGPDEFIVINQKQFYSRGSNLTCVTSGYRFTDFRIRDFPAGGS